MYLKCRAAPGVQLRRVQFKIIWEQQFEFILYKLSLQNKCSVKRIKWNATNLVKLCMEWMVTGLCAYYLTGTFFRRGRDLWIVKCYNTNWRTLSDVSDRNQFLRILHIKHHFTNLGIKVSKKRKEKKYTREMSRRRGFSLHKIYERCFGSRRQYFPVKRKVRKDCGYG